MKNPGTWFCGTAQGSSGATHGSVDSVEVQYEYGLGTLLKRLADSAGKWDAYLAVFGMFSSVSSSLSPGDGANGTGTLLLGDGVQKLKYGADLIVTPWSWLGFGARADVAQPTNHDKEQSFWVISPKIILKTKRQTHEEVSIWYSHYGMGSTCSPSPRKAHRIRRCLVRRGHSRPTRISSESRVRFGGDGLAPA